MSQHHSVVPLAQYHHKSAEHAYNTKFLEVKKKTGMGEYMPWQG
jgi:hypothetical protein